MEDPKEIDSIGYKKKFTICTIISNRTEYEDMLHSFRQAGFNDETEFIYIDNTKTNKYDAFKGINLLLSKAQGEYIIICHQDVLIMDHRDHLEKIISDIEGEETNWGILGNAGGIEIKKYAKYFTNGHNNQEVIGKFPTKVGSLDENFLVINKKANIGLSQDLSGFHLYGTDGCLLANMRGYSCYVIDFMLKHKSFGNVDDTFHKQKNELLTKYKQKLRGRLIQTTCVRFYISSSKIRNEVFNWKPVMFLIKEYFKLKK